MFLFWVVLEMAVAAAATRGVSVGSGGDTVARLFVVVSVVSPPAGPVSCIQNPEEAATFTAVVVVAAAAAIAAAARAATRVCFPPPPPPTATTTTSLMLLLVWFGFVVVVDSAGACDFFRSSFCGSCSTMVGEAPRSVVVPALVPSAAAASLALPAGGGITVAGGAVVVAAAAAAPVVALLSPSVVDMVHYTEQRTRYWD